MPSSFQSLSGIVNNSPNPSIIKDIIGSESIYSPAEGQFEGTFMDNMSKENSNVLFLQYDIPSKKTENPMEKHEIKREKTINDKAFNEIQQSQLINDVTKKGHSNRSILKIIEICVFLSVFVLNVTNFIQKNSSKGFSLNLFYVNAYSFLITNDIYFGSLACIDICLIQENFQIGDVNILARKINQSANDLNRHYYLLNSYIVKMINNKEMIGIYNVLNFQEEYARLLSNWKIEPYNSSLTEEIYSIHHYLRIFNPLEKEDDGGKCRLKKYFFSSKFKTIEHNMITISEEATSEEKYIYYIGGTIIKTVSLSLENLTKITNQILNDYNDKIKMYSVAFNVSILVSDGILFFVIILSIINQSQLIQAQMNYLFTKHDTDDAFFDDILKFKLLTETFSVEESNKYVLFKKHFSEGPMVKELKSQKRMSSKRTQSKREESKRNKKARKKL